MRSSLWPSLPRRLILLFEKLVEQPFLFVQLLMRLFLPLIQFFEGGLELSLLTRIDVVELRDT